MNTVLEKPAPDYAAIKQRQQATWASGDYATIGTTLQIVGETLAEAADVRAGQAVLARQQHHAATAAVEMLGIDPGNQRLALLRAPGGELGTLHHVQRKGLGGLGGETVDLGHAGKGSVRGQACCADAFASSQSASCLLPGLAAL